VIAHNCAPKSRCCFEILLRLLECQSVTHNKGPAKIFETGSKYFLVALQKLSSIESKLHGARKSREQTVRLCPEMLATARQLLYDEVRRDALGAKLP
jgi:hypothetical protein